MKKILKKLSINQQIIFFISFEIIILLSLYAVYLYFVSKTNFYTDNAVFANIVFWLIGFVIMISTTIMVVEKINSPIGMFIEYLKEFDDINFNQVQQEVLNKEGIELTKEFISLQERVFDSIAELKNQNAAIQKLVEEKEKDYEYKRTLVTSLSHDLKTPLTIIYTTISGIRDGIITGDEITKELDNVLSEVEKTTTMLQDVISIYRFDSEISVANLEKCSLLDIVNNVTANFTKLFVKYDQSLAVNFPYDINIMVDIKQFERVLYNLINNAIVHSPVGSNIYINLKDNLQGNTLEIINTGITISQDDLPHIFEPFYKGNKSRTKMDDQGNGLGLYIVSEICKKNGLSISLTNVDNAVNFSIVFPK